MENKKVGFFSRVKIAVAKLENYSLFLEEKMSVAVKYFFLIVLILSLVIAALQTYNIMQMVNKGYEYMKNELPDFSYENGKLTFPERIYAYDEEYDIYMIADTGGEMTEDTLTQYRKDIKSIGVIFLKDQLIYKNGMTEKQYKYSDLQAQYEMGALDKTKLIQEFDNIGKTTIATTLLIAFVISHYIVQLLSVFMDWMIVAIFAIIAARICRINMNFKHCFNISIYALTLSIILNMIYNIAYSLTGFYTEYFRIVYLLISYVYVVAVILIIKSDLLKQQVEVAKIVEVQKEVHEELNHPKDEEDKEKQKPKDDKNKDSDENTLDNEPDGSEI